MQYLNTMLWETFEESIPAHGPDIPTSPEVNVVNQLWQKNKCNLLGLPFESVSKQPVNYNGQPLKKYKPWETENIIRDGNCLFRCLSNVITGNQNSHLQLRTIIARYIATKGTSRLGWYFKTKQTTPCEYLLSENLTLLEGTWGSDVEIMAASSILDVDIYIANDVYRKEGTLIPEVRWSLIRASPNPTAAIYITNYCDHYEPVISMLDSPTPTYGVTISDDKIYTVE